MRTLFFFSFVIILLASFDSRAQEQEVVRGIIVDSATFNPLPYVNIRIKNTFRGTNTDTNGNFSLLAGKRDTLLISLVGYETIVLPLWDWEPSMIRMAESRILLKTVTITAKPLDYEGMFDEQNALLAERKNRFYYSKAKKEKRRVGWLIEDNIRVKTYVDVVINNPSTKARLMKENNLTEEEYYTVLAKFNEKNYQVMYYLTAGELITLLNNFFKRTLPTK